jgi:hypothetical protein
MTLYMNLYFLQLYASSYAPFDYFEICKIDMPGSSGADAQLDVFHLILNHGYPFP